ncbi:MAG: hypothetical protein DRJ52_02920 [Thermoprotei archaeon]|nr:MAG: hypothetical protein DRJ52_02920 [Thermoprotei archaeon]
MKVEVYGLGEVLVDIIPEEPGKYREGTRLTVHFGGAPANTIIGVSRLGHKAGLIAAVGEDLFGEFILSTLEREGVYTKWVKVKKARTSLAFVVLEEGGERSFFFYRKPWVETADTMLKLSDVDLDDVLKAKVVHVSGVSTAYAPLSDTVFEIMRAAYENGLEASFDPNYRPDIWGSGERALKTFDKYLKYTTLLTMGLDELTSLFNTSDYRKVSEEVLEKYPSLKWVAVRLGARGAYVKTRETEVYQPAFRVKAVDTTGAGDAWTAGFIVFHVLEGRDLETSVKIANAVGALTCTKYGATTALPTRTELEEFLKSRD